MQTLRLRIFVWKLGFWFWCIRVSEINCDWYGNYAENIVQGSFWQHRYTFGFDTFDRTTKRLYLIVIKHLNIDTSNYEHKIMEFNKIHTIAHQKKKKNIIKLSSNTANATDLLIVSFRIYHNHNVDSQKGYLLHLLFLLSIQNVNARIIYVYAFRPVDIWIKTIGFPGVSVWILS